MDDSQIRISLQRNLFAVPGVCPMVSTCDTSRFMRCVHQPVHDCIEHTHLSAGSWGRQHLRTAKHLFWPQKHLEVAFPPQACHGLTMSFQAGPPEQCAPPPSSAGPPRRRRAPGGPAAAGVHGPAPGSDEVVGRLKMAGSVIRGEICRCFG